MKTTARQVKAFIDAHEDIFALVSEYAYQANGWEITNEEDHEELKEAILEKLLTLYDNGVR